MITINEHTVLRTLPKWVSRSGTLRASIMGINDGLVSNFCLVMGLAGGTGNNHEIVLITGFIGLLAGSLSMATGEYVSVKAQRDVYEKQVELEKQHLAENPAIEKTKLIEYREGKKKTTKSFLRYLSEFWSHSEAENSRICAKV